MSSVKHWHGTARTNNRLAQTNILIPYAESWSCDDLKRSGSFVAVRSMGIQVCAFVCWGATNVQASVCTSWYCLIATGSISVNIILIMPEWPSQYINKHGEKPVLATLSSECRPYKMEAQTVKLYKPKLFNMITCNLHKTHTKTYQTPNCTKKCQQALY